MGLHPLPGNLSAPIGDLKDVFELLENVFLACSVDLLGKPPDLVFLAFKVNLCIIANIFES